MQAIEMIPETTWAINNLNLQLSGLSSVDGKPVAAPFDGSMLSSNRGALALAAAVATAKGQAHSVFPGALNIPPEGGEAESSSSAANRAVRWHEAEAASSRIRMQTAGRTTPVNPGPNLVLVLVAGFPLLAHPFDCADWIVAQFHHLSFPTLAYMPVVLNSVGVMA